MTNLKTTKRALLSSAVALLVCFAMLLGTTFAWFTDSVTSSGNIIQSGTLDVSLEHANEALTDVNDSKWADASTGAIFNYDKWEPGYTVVKYVKVENEGTLDLKFVLNIVPNSDEAAIYDLADVIEVYMVSGASAVNRAALTTDSAAYVGTLTSLIEDADGAARGVLYADDADKAGKVYEIYTIALKMSESAGNEYQDLSVGGGFAVQLLATQLASESDSFNNQYDVESDYVAEVKTADELATALRAGGLVKLANDISVTESLNIPAGVVVNLDLNGKTITGTKGRDADNNRIHVIVNNGILTIKDGTVKSAGNDGGSAICNNAGATLTIEDVTLYGAPQSDPVYEAGVSKPFPSYAVNNYGNAVVNGATIKSYHGAIATGDNGVTVINDADIDVGLGQSTGITSYAIYSYGNAQVTVNDGKFALTKQEVYVNGGNTFLEYGNNPIIINGGNYINTSFSTGAGREYVIKGGTFDKDPSAYVANGYVATKNADGTYTVVKGASVANVADLTNAIANGGNIVLTEDIAITNTLMTTKDVVIDLNGNTMTTPSSGAVFQSQSNASPDITITSSVPGAAINVSGGDTAVLLGYGSTVIKNVTINVTGCDNYSPSPFNVYGDLTIGEGTVVNIDYLGSALISNSGAVNIVIDGAEINIGTFKRNGVMIDLNNATTFEMKNTTMKINNYVLSQFGGEGLINKIDGVTIENCTFDITDSNGASCTFVADTGLGRYDLVQK